MQIMQITLKSREAELLRTLMQRHIERDGSYGVEAARILDQLSAEKHG